jgi:hypothetical protein
VGNRTSKAAQGDQEGTAALDRAELDDENEGDERQDQDEDEADSGSSHFP